MSADLPPASPSRGGVSRRLLLDASAVAALDGTSSTVAHARRLGVPQLRRDRSMPITAPGGGIIDPVAAASPAEQQAAAAAVAAASSILPAAASLSPKKDAASPLALADGSPVLGPLNHRPALIRFSSTGSRSSLGLPSTSSNSASGGLGSFRSSAGGGINLAERGSPGGAAGGSLDFGNGGGNSFSPRSQRSRSNSGNLRRASAGSLDEVAGSSSSGAGNKLSSPTSDGGTQSLSPQGGGGLGSGGWEHGLRGSGNFESTFRLISAQNELLLQKKEQKRQKVLRTSSQLALLDDDTDADQQQQQHSMIRRSYSAQDAERSSGPLATVPGGNTPEPSPTSAESSHRARENRERERAARAAAAARYRAEREREENKGQEGQLEEEHHVEPCKVTVDNGEDAADVIVAVVAAPAPLPAPVPEPMLLPEELPDLPRSSTVPLRPAVRTAGLQQHAHTLRSPASADGSLPPALAELPPSEAALVGMQNQLEAEHAHRQQQQAAEMNRIAQAIADSQQQQQQQLQPPLSAGSGSSSASSSDSATASPPQVHFSPIGGGDDSSTSTAPPPAIIEESEERKADRESSPVVPSPLGPSAMTSPASPSSSVSSSSASGSSKPPRSKNRSSAETAEILRLSGAALKNGVAAAAGSKPVAPASAALPPPHSRSPSSERGSPQMHMLDPSYAYEPRGSRNNSYNSRPSRLAALPPLPPDTPSSSTPSSRQGSRPSSRQPSPGRSPSGPVGAQEVAAAAAAGSSSGHLDSHRPAGLQKAISYSLSTSSAANGFSAPNSPAYLEPYGARTYAEALASAVASGSAAAAATGGTRSSSRSPSPSSGRKQKHVVFAAELTEEQSYHPRSRSVTPQPLHSHRGDPTAATPASSASNRPRKPKSILRPPSNQHISQHMRHVVQQVISPAAGGSRGSGPGSGVVTTFSSHTPFVSPLSLLKFQVALFHDQVNLHNYCINVTRTGSVLIKYNSSGKPMNRWFYVLETASEIKLCWAAPKTPSKNKTWSETNPNGLGFKQPNDDTALVTRNQNTSSHHTSSGGSKSPGAESSASEGRSRGSSTSLLPSFSIGRWKFNVDRSRSLLEICGLHYGPYYSRNFCRFLDKADNATGKPWLCFSVQTKDRTIDLVCSNEHEVTAWFLGLQAQAPQTVYYMSRGMILWQRLIMKLNYYSLEQIKRVFAKREAQAAQAAQARASVNQPKSPATAR